jgi:cytochrome c peroxidase
MKKFITLLTLFSIALLYSFTINNVHSAGQYISFYHQKINAFSETQRNLIAVIKSTDIGTADGVKKIKEQIATARISLKGLDFWLRYVEPIAYKKVNGPLPVEWETEVFEKFESPYKREGAGLTLAELYLEEETINKDSLSALIQSSLAATKIYLEDSITSDFQKPHHFFLANRLFLLNLSAIYTTGFECPDSSNIIPELRSMLGDVSNIYTSFNESFSATRLTDNYLELYKKSIEFVNKQPANYSEFDHFNFIRDYINPLFTINQQLIRQYRVYTKSFVDYSLNNASSSIFSKDLYFGQNSKGIFRRVTDEAALKEIEKIGKLLFYDPILSGNNQRSCNSCHKSTEYFTDTTLATSFQYDKQKFLSRNSPSLINSTYNHLLMADGKHISMQNQAKDVMTNHQELGSNEKALLEKVLSCHEYKNAFKKFLKFTPQETEIGIEHITSALTVYYSKFSNYYTGFDEAMINKKDIDPTAKKGFNLFMSKAQCGTCHFVPQFNGVKPPYVGSEFEVLGVPADTGFKVLSADSGRYVINPVPEMLNAFKTGTIRNAAHTKPYMHNGIFSTLEQVVDFYNAGGGAGRGLKVNNQTLSSDPLKLFESEKKSLVQFMTSLTESINFESSPEKLPSSNNKLLNNRKVGGDY